MMKRIEYKKFGGPEVLKVKEFRNFSEFTDDDEDVYVTLKSASLDVPPYTSEISIPEIPISKSDTGNSQFISISIEPELFVLSYV